MDNRRRVVPPLAWAVLAALAAFVSGASSASAGVTVVDAGGGSAVIQSALDAAVDGDIVIVLAGDSDQLEWLTLSGKGLTLASWPAGSRTAVSSLTIRDVPAARRVIVRGFEVTAGITVLDCAGSIWLEECAVAPYSVADFCYSGSYPAWHGALVEGCAAVVFTRCDLSGRDGVNESICCGPAGWHDATAGGDGLRTVSSKVALYDCALHGGMGGTPNACQYATGKPAGVGLHAAGSTVHLAGCGVAGGDQQFFWPSASAASGLFVEDPASSVSIRDCTIVAGTGTPMPPDLVSPPGVLSLYSAPARSIAVTAPIAEGQSGAIAIAGQPGDFTALFVSTGGGFLPFPGKQGVFQLGAPLLGPIVLGVNPAPSGAWTIPFVAGPLFPASSLGQCFLLQLVVSDGVQVSFEGTTSFVVVDSSLP